MLINWLRADIKGIVHHPKLLAASLYPVLLVFFLRFVFIPLAGLISPETGFPLQNYYSIVAITLVTIIPILPGIFYSRDMDHEIFLEWIKGNQITSTKQKTAIYMRVIRAACLSLIILLVTIFLTDPVPTQGWLRSIYVSLLLAIQTPYVFLFISSLSGNKFKGLTFLLLYMYFYCRCPFRISGSSPGELFCICLSFVLDKLGLDKLFSYREPPLWIYIYSYNLTLDLIIFQIVYQKERQLIFLTCIS